MVLFQLSSSQVCSLSVYYLKTMKTFMLTELKIVLVDLWIAPFLQCTNSSFFHFLTLFYNAGVEFAPVCVTSCKSIWVDHIYFPVEGALKTSFKKTIRVFSLNCLYQDVLLRDIHSLYNFDCEIFCKYTFLLFKQLSKMCNEFYTNDFQVVWYISSRFCLTQSRVVILIKLCKQ